MVCDKKAQYRLYHRNSVRYQNVVLYSPEPPIRGSGYETIGVTMRGNYFVLACISIDGRCNTQVVLQTSGQYEKNFFVLH